MESTIVVFSLASMAETGSVCACGGINNEALVFVFRVEGTGLLARAYAELPQDEEQQMARLSEVEKTPFVEGALGMAFDFSRCQEVEGYEEEGCQQVGVFDCISGTAGMAYEYRACKKVADGREDSFDAVEQASVLACVEQVVGVCHGDYSETQIHFEGRGQAKADEAVEWLEWMEGTGVYCQHGAIDG